MLLFQTILDVSQPMTKEEFIRLVFEWNQQNPDEQGRIPGLAYDGEQDIRFGGDSVWMHIKTVRDIMAVRYENEKSRTDIIMNFAENKMAVRLEKKQQRMFKKQSFEVPCFLNMLNLPSTPEYITESNAEMLGDIKCQFPVLYISRTREDTEPVNVQLLADRLRGTARILVESSIKLNGKIREVCKGKNAYHGAIRIYYPDGTYSLYTYSENLLETVFDSVIKWYNLQHVHPEYTWQGVSEMILKTHLSNEQSLRKAAESEKELAQSEKIQTESETAELIDSVDEEIQKLRQQVQELTRVNEALTCENHGLRSRLDRTERIPALCYGEEKELFPDEIREMVLLALEDKLSQSKGRQADVLRDIIASNGGCQHTAEAKAARIKNALKGRRKLDVSLRQLLSEMGFVITEEGKHYKLTYYGDDRYWTTLGKTPSDDRSGNNMALILVKNFL